MELLLEQIFYDKIIAGLWVMGLETLRAILQTFLSKRKTPSTIFSVVKWTITEKTIHFIPAVAGMKFTLTIIEKSITIFFHKIHLSGFEPEKNQFVGLAPYTTRPQVCYFSLFIFLFTITSTA